MLLAATLLCPLILASQQSMESGRVLHFDRLAEEQESLRAQVQHNGYVVVRGVPGFPVAYERFLDRLAAFSALPVEQQQLCTPPSDADAFGWSRGIEQFEGVVDLYKGSFYAAIPDPQRRNMWPAEDAVPGFRDSYLQLAGVIRAAGEQVARLLELPVPVWECVGRALDYAPFPLPGGQEALSKLPPRWCGEHRDLSGLTGICPAVYYDSATGERWQGPEPASAGLYVLGQRANIPGDCLGFQIGEVSQLLTNDRTKATLHHVEGAWGFRRRTFALFFAPPMDFVMTSESTAFPDRFRQGMTYAEWHQCSLDKYKVPKKSDQ